MTTVCEIMFADGTRGLLPGIFQRFSTAVAAEEPISPPVQVNYTKLLINGDFVESASGMYMYVTFFGPETSVLFPFEWLVFSYSASSELVLSRDSKENKLLQ
jgi:hypothetical protein